MVYISATFFDIFRNHNIYSRVFIEKLTVAKLVAILFTCQRTKKYTASYSQVHDIELHSKWLLPTKLHNKYFLLIDIFIALSNNKLPLLPA